MIAYIYFLILMNHTKQVNDGYYARGMNYIYFLTLLRCASLGKSQASDNTLNVGGYKLDFFDPQKTYNEAQNVCNQRGSWLVEINDEEIEKAVENVANNQAGVNVWIGLSKHSGEWKWGDYSLLRYRNWKNGAPDASIDAQSYKCALKSIGETTWINKDCSETRKYVCQSDNNYSPSNLVYIDDLKKNYDDAKKACQSTGAQLVNIKTSSLNEEIVQKLREKHPVAPNVEYYTGGNDIGKEGTWVWGDDSTVNETFWYTGDWNEPNGNGRENCIVVMSQHGAWADVTCSKSFAYICQSDLTGSCSSSICNKKGTCKSVKYRYHCSCNGGYFGTKCEKDLIQISSRTETITVNKGKTASVDLTVMSYDGDVTISQKKSWTGDLINSMKIGIDGTVYTKTFPYQMGVQLANATYKFFALPTKNESAYRRKVNVKVIVTDHCDPSPCKNKGSCNYVVVEPYYNCTCSPAYEGPTCTTPKFYQRSNCEYHINYGGTARQFSYGKKFCENQNGTLAMIKLMAIQDFLEQTFIDIYVDASNTIELWVGGQKEGENWLWLDGTKIPMTGAGQKWKQMGKLQMLISSYQSTRNDMFWYSKNTGEVINGFICEKAIGYPCSSIDCLNGGSCIAIGCQANCRCGPGYYGDTCAKDSIIITPDKTMYAAVKGGYVNVTLTIESNDGLVNIKYYNSSSPSNVLGTKRNVNGAVNFSIGPFEVSKENESYTFQATPASSVIYYKYATIFVGIEGPPVIDISPTILSLSASESWSAIVCSSSGFPAPTATWKFYGERVTSNRSQTRYQVVSGPEAKLYFTAGARDQVGLYTCFAENVVKGTKQIANNTAFVRATILLVGNNSKIAKSVFKNTTISCTFEGYPEPYIYWQSGGKNVENLAFGDSGIFAVRNSTENVSRLFQKTSTLTIKLTEYLGATDVTCFARNKYEKSSNLIFHLNRNLVISGDRSFRIYENIEKNYTEAQEYCGTGERNLAKISDQTTQQILGKELTKRTPSVSFFIGGRKRSEGTTGIWRWHDDSVFYNQTKHKSYGNTTRSEVDGSFTAWYSEEPGIFECMRMEASDWKWRSGRCNVSDGFICESSVGGIPTFLEIFVDECTSDIAVSWIPAEQAVGVTHRFEIRRADSFEKKANQTKKRTPSHLSKFTKRIKDFEYDTSYNVKIIVCPECPYPYSTTKNVTTYALIDAEKAILESVNVTDKGTQCVLSWTPQSPKGIIGFMVKREITINRASAKTRNMTNITTKENLTLTYQHKYDMEPNRKYTFEVAARTCLGIGPTKPATGFCVSETAAPSFVPVPVVSKGLNGDGTMSLQIRIPDQTNGSISCVFVLVVYNPPESKASASKTYEKEDLQNASSKSNSDVLAAGDKYIAIAVKSSEILSSDDNKNMLTKKLGGGSTSSCDIADSSISRKKREVPSTEITASNRALEDDTTYSGFVVTTTPGKNEIYFKSSKVFQFRTPPDASTNASLLGGVIGALVFLCVIAGIAAIIIIKRRKQKSVSNDVRMNEIEPREDLVYANLAMDRAPASETEIPLSQLQVVYNSMVADKGLRFNEQFEKLKLKANSLVYPTEVASNPNLKKKNRYKNILPSDAHRVVIREGKDSGYINACYIDGFRQLKKFIATQGPLPSTIDDFWQMIVEQKCTVVVMLTKCSENGKRKCEKYWPDLGVEKNFNNISVLNIEEASYGSFKVRTLSVMQANQTLTVNHLHFFNWPDHGVPVTTSDIVRLHYFLSNFNSSTPIVVHCSAGAGRTGAFIAFDFLLREAEYLKSVDVYNCVLKMRKQRVDMVQNSNQYILAHKLLLEDYLFGRTDRDIGQTLAAMSDNSTLRKEFKNLSSIAPINEDMHGDQQKYAYFNRDKNIIPYNRNKVVVVMNSDDVEAPYINASTLETYDPNTTMIASQGPMSKTVEHFWRAVLDNDVNTIIMLTKCVENNTEQSAQYWPEENKSMDLKGLKIHSRTVNTTGKVTTREFEVTREEDERTIVQYQYTGWSPEQCPANPSDVLELIEKMHSSVRRDKDAAVLIHCSNGAGRTGAFCAIVNLIERLKTENRVDVFRAVKDLRDCRPGIVQTLEEYRFCYDAISAYLNSFSVYSNFQVSKAEVKEENIYENLTG